LRSPFKCYSVAAPVSAEISKSLTSKEYIKCQTKFHAIIQVYECMWVAKFEPQKHVKMSHVGKTQQIGEE